MRMPACGVVKVNFSLLGSVYLQEKSRSSQQLSISSLVSVKFGNEGRLLLEDQTPGPSHFHRCETPVTTTAVSDWDDQTKLDEFSDFGNASIQ